MGPWEIFHGTDHELSEEDDYKFHVFTRLKKASLHRVSRVAGCGTWHEDKKLEKIFADKKKKMGLIGLKKNFTFRIKNGSKKSHWIMQEFSLADFYNDYALAVASSSQQQPPITIPQPEFRLVENSSSVLQFITEETTYRDYVSIIESTDQVLKFFDIESTKDLEVILFNSTNWNNISGVVSENNVLSLPPIQQEGNININGGEWMVIEPELSCFESDWRFFNAAHFCLE
ncbi:hypothetical protein Ddye_029596 [Dipteronia dyeriana]|uniref:NAC domain-containing protein n=1 Tax=Dipteronia dyeriana TaxID=168575 RepID=A0AAD9TFU1_9ROSI|nr:hypothetical protein Ddye_029596 [Dipteronia dyeriana]